MEPAWREGNAIYINESLEMEAIAVDLALNHFFELGLTGGLLRVGGKPLPSPWATAERHHLPGAH